MPPTRRRPLLPLPAAAALLLAGCLTGAAPDPGAAAATAEAAAGWARALAGGDREYVHALALDAAGNLYAAGFFLGATDLGGAGPSGAAGTAAPRRLVSAGDADAFVAKLGPDGALAWARRFGGDGQDEAKGVAVGADGEIYVTGFFSRRADFGPGNAALTSDGSSDVFLARLDSDGEVVWLRRLGGDGGDAAAAVAADGRGQVAVTGFFSGELALPGGSKLGAAGGRDAFVARFDAEGDLGWAWSFGGAGGDEGRAATLAPDGTLVVAGTFSGEASAKGCPDLAGAGARDLFLARLGAGGEPLWCRRAGGAGTDSVEALAIETAGRLWAVGQFSGRLDLEPGAGGRHLVSDGPTDGFVLAFDPRGGLERAARLGGAGNDYLFGVAAAEPGRPLVAGFELPLARPGGEPAETFSFVHRLAEDGTPAVTRTLHAGSGLQLFALAVDGAGTPHVAGVYKGEARLEAEGAREIRLPAAGKIDAFVARLPLPPG